MSQTQTDFLPWPDAVAEQYRRAGFWKGETLGDLLRHSAHRFADKTAIIAGERRWTYQELDQRANQLSAGLHKLGLRAGDHVVVQLPNIGELVEVLFALFRLGVIPVMALPAHRRFELTHFCQKTAAKAYFIADTFAGCDYRALARELQPLTQLEHIIAVGDAQEFIPLTRLYQLGDFAEGQNLAQPKADALALLQLSGGTTNVPKLIPRTHDDYFYSLRTSAELCGLSRSTVFLAVLPAVHNFPLSSPGVLGTLYAGGTVILAPNGAPQTALPLIEQHQVTITALVPPLALAWLSAAEHSPYNLNSLAVLQVGGAKLSAEAAQKMLSVFPCQLQQVFGMAEGLVNYTRLDDPEELVLHTQGKPMSPADEIRVVDDEDRPLPDGQIGHLLTRGPYTIRSYYRDASQTHKSFTLDGFYRTGDLVRRTAQGYLVVSGRAKDQINRGGEKISAEEVENQLLAHPAVHDVAIVGMPDPYLGERTCAFIIAKPHVQEDLSLPAIKAFLRARGLADYKLPDRIELTDAFPETSFGKVSKKALREQLAKPLAPHAAAQTAPAL